MRRVIVESPYAGELQLNVLYAAACLRDCLSRGEAPFASHLLYAATGATDDGDPVERALGIAAGLRWGEAADATIVYHDLGISEGMRDGILHATVNGRPVEYRALPDWNPAERLAATRTRPFPPIEK